MTEPSKASKGRIILGVDPGSLITGYGVIQQNGTSLKHIESGVIRPDSKKPLQKRLAYIYDRFFEIIMQNQPESMAIETAFLGKNVKSMMTLAHARGVILLAGAQMQLPIHEYSPLDVKKATVGYGRATKDQIAEMVRHMFKLQSHPHRLDPNQTDALAIALCHGNHANLMALTEKSLASQGLKS